jgi:hypothetical protein
MDPLSRLRAKPPSSQAAKHLLQGEPDPACNLDKSSLVAPGACRWKVPPAWTIVAACDLPSVSSSRKPFLAPLSFLSSLLLVNKDDLTSCAPDSTSTVAHSLFFSPSRHRSCGGVICGPNFSFSWRWCRPSFTHWLRRTKFKMPTRLNRDTWVIIICTLRLLDLRYLVSYGRTFMGTIKRNGMRSPWFIRHLEDHNSSSSHLR